ncbi:hypothetical protein [Alicyclobacillus herbarius]|uniref:hypothetical protein n=1 Tax=Alicyclobacillus herbarius TaxID=122960 RepID=UPI000416E426|nr:hypothetical protein [Alicyclobacillus herbarius]
MEKSSQTGFLDLRRLIGVLLTFDGLIITVYGLVAHPKLADVPLNLDLWWGLLVLIVGVLFLVASFRPPRPTEPEPHGFDD